MNFNLNAGGIVLGLVGCFGLGGVGIAMDTDVPKFFFMTGLIGGALVGNAVWSATRRRKIATCVHEWAPHPKKKGLLRCPLCGGEGKQRDVNDGVIS